MRSNERLLWLVEVALGERDETELGPISKAEQTRLAQLRQIAAGLNEQWHIAPQTTVEAAKSIFERRHAETMRVVSTSLRPAAARGAAAEVVHAAFESHDHTVRVMYLREPDAWRVVGEAPGPGWSVLTLHDATVSDDSGRFEATVEGDAMPELVLVKDNVRLKIVPPTATQ